MSRPRVFVSSTYFDLKHLRASLETFISGLGFEVVLSEKGRIAYSPDIPLDESCYKEAQASDILVLIVGGRYGTEASARTGPAGSSLLERYDSITRKEYRAAREKGVPIYILVERSVYSEYETYLRNKSNAHVVYAHVDSVNVFALIEDIVSQPKNNPIHQFDKHSDIEAWLREQWAGLFRELLQRMKDQEQIATLQSQVAQLAEINTTLKRYLEAVVEKVAPNQSRALIATEEKRLGEARVDRELSRNSLAMYLMRHDRVSLPRLKECISEAQSVGHFLELILATPGFPVEDAEFASDEGTRQLLWQHVNEMRQTLGLRLFTAEDNAAFDDLPR